LPGSRARTARRPGSPDSSDTDARAVSREHPLRPTAMAARSSAADGVRLRRSRNERY
jgi:hypothetical protein